MSLKTNEVSRRYARSLFELAQEDNTSELILSELREINKAYTDNEVLSFMKSSLVNSEDKLKVIEVATSTLNFSQTTKSFLQTLAKKDRLSCIPEITVGYEECADEKNQVVRGTVRSTHVLTPDERAEIEKTVQAAIGKKVILIYSEDESVIGGIEAHVGGYTFDDSLLTHLNRLKEELKRSVH